MTIRRLLFVFLALACPLLATVAAKDRVSAKGGRANVESEYPAETDDKEAPGAAPSEEADTDARENKRSSIKPGVSPDPAIALLEPRTYRLKIVVKVEAPEEADSRNVVVVAPIPMDWPEQRARQIGAPKFTAGGKYTETVKRGQCATMKFTIPTIAAGESAGVELLYEITRWRMEFDYPTEQLDMPHGAPAEVRDQFVKNDAPGLEMKHPKIVGLTRELEKEHAGERPWDLVKGFWQWTRDNVEFKNGNFRGALFAIEQKCGDCEEMSALFVSMCRLSGVIARSVWVEGHNYPEFYLVDSKGKGHWIPAQVVGPAWFGEMTEYRPIFQKGDRFFDPFQRQYVRYTPQTMKADGKVQPKFTVDHQILADSDINGPTYENSREP
ncbi:MAG TPA: transglutaminase-like domain-containing protein [Pirellulales bacterium]|nr:transglutaminase-like domain-containing protein [Pirellulales bacterium]